MFQDDFLACAHRAARSRPPPTLSSAQRAIHEARTRPPPWLSPTPVAVPVVAPVGPEEPDNAPPSGAFWPKLHGILLERARKRLHLPYGQELEIMLGCSPTSVGRAFRSLAEFGYITREIRPRPNCPAEMRVVIRESGAVLVTRGWV